MVIENFSACFLDFVLNIMKALSYSLHETKISIYISTIKTSS